ncbi:MAG: hypothetical protein ACTSXG_03865 [Alphaproteobacteria bacterium]
MTKKLYVLLNIFAMVGCVCAMEQLYEKEPPNWSILAKTENGVIYDENAKEGEKKFTGPLIDGFECFCKKLIQGIDIWLEEKTKDIKIAINEYKENTLLLIESHEKWNVKKAGCFEKLIKGENAEKAYKAFLYYKENAFQLPKDLEDEEMGVFNNYFPMISNQISNQPCIYSGGKTIYALENFKNVLPDALKEMQEQDQKYIKLLKESIDPKNIDQTFQKYLDTAKQLRVCTEDTPKDLQKFLDGMHYFPAFVVCGGDEYVPLELQ